MAISPHAILSASSHKPTMGSVLHFLLPAPFPRIKFPSSFSSSSRTKTLILSPTAARKTPRGFGSTISSQKSKNRKQKKRLGQIDDEEEDDEDEEERDDDAGTIPEVVTNRMMQRMGLSVGIPLGIGLLFFPFFYYLKVAVKLDVPNWIPLLVSFFFFGASLLGVSYGIVSASWDPLREGSVLGWNEARRNWPVFWQSLRRGEDKK
ncbi:protein PAM68, chloroplastic [Dendrobium catenatum]|nr:protein PAM68, chloroplastic [Dendrobium catenatum]XP_020681611.1 protein PAM68, chloroplastic [Dendrobium catenatum]XP_020681612.1 protein PAM68, chloroplastic [Dendrobium catenatum]XP_020681613.1 protein PAM68, chloroplastic [Dendrobium catenatum]XP_020681614.1 protein PAM68, chloroplastic [Dendrobium catenatum]XP_028549964.1 protein PAM68, chloroplastic [Dendrobium catenatum]